MPDQQSHEQAAKRFLALYNDIPENHPEGRVLALFYCALHLIETVAATEGVHNRNHPEREGFVRKHRMWKHYRPLLEASEHARYLAGGRFTMNSPQIHEQLRKRRLKALEEWSEVYTSAGAGKKSPEP